MKRGNTGCGLKDKDDDDNNNSNNNDNNNKSNKSSRKKTTTTTITTTTTTWTMKTTSRTVTIDEDRAMRTTPSDVDPSKHGHYPVSILRSPLASMVIPLRAERVNC